MYSIYKHEARLRRIVERYHRRIEWVERLPQWMQYLLRGYLAYLYYRHDSAFDEWEEISDEIYFRSIE